MCAKAIGSVVPSATDIPSGDDDHRHGEVTHQDWCQVAKDSTNTVQRGNEAQCALAKVKDDL